MRLQSLFDLYLTELRGLYDTENQIMKALPKMIDGASSDDLRTALRDHWDQTELHINRLEQVFEMHAEDPKGEKSGGMEGLIKEGNHLLASAEATVRDATLISVAQRIEHYEIASYGCVRTYAEHLGFERAAQILQETLLEEEETDRKLTAIAKSRVNVAAARQTG